MILINPSFPFCNGLKGININLIRDLLGLFEKKLPLIDTFQMEVKIMIPYMNMLIMTSNEDTHKLSTTIPVIS
jgi:hypothetical protein